MLVDCSGGLGLTTEDTGVELPGSPGRLNWRRRGRVAAGLRLRRCVISPESVVSVMAIYALGAARSWSRGHHGRAAGAAFQGQVGAEA